MIAARALGSALPSPDTQPDGQSTVEAATTVAALPVTSVSALIVQIVHQIPPNPVATANVIETSQPHNSLANAQDLPHQERLEVAGQLDPSDLMDVYRIPLDEHLESLRVRLWSEAGPLGVPKRMWLIDTSGVTLGSWAVDNTTQLTMTNLAALSQANNQTLYLGITSAGLLTFPADSYLLELTFQTQTTTSNSDPTIRDSSSSQDSSWTNSSSTTNVFFPTIKTNNPPLSQGVLDANAMSIATAGFQGVTLQSPSLRGVSPEGGVLAGANKVLAIGPRDQFKTLIDLSRLDLPAFHPGRRHPGEDILSRGTSDSLEESRSPAEILVPVPGFGGVPLLATSHGAARDWKPGPFPGGPLNFSAGFLERPNSSRNSVPTERDRAEHTNAIKAQMEDRAARPIALGTALGLTAALLGFLRPDLPAIRQVAEYFRRLSRVAPGPRGLKSAPDPRLPTRSAGRLG